MSGKINYGTSMQWNTVIKKTELALCVYWYKLSLNYIKWQKENTEEHMYKLPFGEKRKKKYVIACLCIIDKNWNILEGGDCVTKE